MTVTLPAKAMLPDEEAGISDALEDTLDERDLIVKEMVKNFNR